VIRDLSGVELAGASSRAGHGGDPFQVLKFRDLRGQVQASLTLPTPNETRVARVR